MPFRSSTKKPAAYTAVLMDFGDELMPLKQNNIDDDDKKLPLIWKSEDEKEEDPPHKLRAAQLLGGSLIGVASAVAGLYLLNGGLDFPSCHVFLFALVWSSITAATAYGVFAIVIQLQSSYFQSSNDNSIIDDEAAQSQPADPLTEYNFALGVFVGFCSTCTVHDALSGVPYISILCTAGVAVAWAVFMAICTTRGSSSLPPNNLPETHQFMQELVV